MRRRPSIPFLVVATLGLATAPIPGAAQQTMLLRYQPKLNAMTHALLWSDASITVKEFTGSMAELGLDTLVLELSALHGFTDRVLQASAPYMVSRTIDSARARSRMLGAPWSRVPQLEELAGLKANLAVDNRLQVTSVNVLDRESIPEETRFTLQALGAAGLDLVLPEQPVGIGQRWATDITFPFNTQSGAEGGAVSATTVKLVAPSSMTLDSIVVRGLDTLAYLRIAGTFRPVTIDERSDTTMGTATISGGFTGTLIWSTGWSAFVSGALRTRLGMKANVMSGGREGGMTMVFDIRTRLGIRL